MRRAECVDAGARYGCAPASLTRRPAMPSRFEVRAYANVDDAFVVWRPLDAHPIAGCRGFMLRCEQRAADGTTQQRTLETWVGFATATPAPAGAHEGSDVWPIQRYTWADYFARDCSAVRYQVVPMVGSDKDHLTPDEPQNATDDWSDWVSVSTGHTSGFDAYFNRGIVASQWLERQLGGGPPAAMRRTLADEIQDPKSAVRAYLAGEALVGLRTFLTESYANGRQLYFALYELNDPELIQLIITGGAHCHVLLANGTHTTQTPDENAAARAQLRTAGVEVHDRLVGGEHLAHNKFVVACNAAGAPEMVWTGSLNWTMTGLCTQANNALLVKDAGVTASYRAYWDRLQGAGDAYPPSLTAGNDATFTATCAAPLAVGQATATLCLCPVPRLEDLAYANTLIARAEQGILFLMFFPGPNDTLLNTIRDLDRPDLFIHGVVNQDPQAHVDPAPHAAGVAVTLVDRGQALPADPRVLVPAAIDERLSYWQPELKQFSLVMIHSKIIVIDPFGANPIVMTGSHNMGPKASGTNDDNLVIIEHAPGLAMEYAVNIMGIYGQYKWRYDQLLRERGATAAEAAANPLWQGLRDDDAWQQDYLTSGTPRNDELRFWFGEAASVAQPA